MHILQEREKRERREKRDREREREKEKERERERETTKVPNTSLVGAQGDGNAISGKPMCGEKRWQKLIFACTKFDGSKP